MLFVKKISFIFLFRTSYQNLYTLLSLKINVVDRGKFSMETLYELSIKFSIQRANKSHHIGVSDELCTPISYGT